MKFTADLRRFHPGLDIAAACDAVICASSFDPEAASSIANAMAGRDAQVQYAIFNRHMADTVARQAASLARGGNHMRAAGLGELHEALGQVIREAEAYNLDKRQHVMGLLRLVHGKVGAGA